MTLPPSNKLQLKIRENILKMSLSSREGHVASSFSIVEILLAIATYMNRLGKLESFMSHLILSKGHAVFALYGLMREIDLLTDADIDSVCKYDSYLIGHAPVIPHKGFLVGTGSLGHGMSIGLGKAYANVLSGISIPLFVVVGDGELNEGSCWEALMLMQKFQNLNVRIFIDNNQSSTRAIPMSRVLDSLSQGWKTVNVDGHSIDSMLKILEENDGIENLIVICNTQKGYPLKSMINNPAWHHRSPSADEASSFGNEILSFFGA